MSSQPEQRIPESEQPVTPGDWGRRGRRRYVSYDPVNRVVWAAMLLMAGAILLADQIGALPTYKSAGTWDWIMLGAGTILLLAELARAVSPDFGRPVGWQLIGGLVLIGLGASSVFGISTSLLWPAGLILLGIVLLVRNVVRR